MISKNSNYETLVEISFECFMGRFLLKSWKKSQIVRDFEAVAESPLIVFDNNKNY